MSLMMSRVLGGLESGRVAADLSEALARIERTIGVNTHYSSFDLVGARRWLEEFGACASSSSSLPREISVDGNVILQGKSIPIRTYNPSAVDTLVFAHGGAWCIGSIDTVDVLCRWIALRTGIRVVSLGYSLAPEAPFPQAILDCSEFISTVLRDAAKTGARVFVAGDSAGANIGAMSLLRLTWSERSQVTGFISLYGAYARKMNLSSHRLFGDGRFGLSSAQMEWFWEMYAPHSINADPAQLTPLEATLNDFPPTLCVATECDMLLDDTLAFYSRLAAANVEVSLSLWPNLSHGCLHLVDQVESVTRAATVIVTFIERSRQRPTISPAAAMIPPSQSGPGGSAGRRHLLARRPHAGTTDAIARSIMVGEFRPGSQLLNEDDASAAYGVSRSAYREAIRTLSAKGLIVALPKVGTRIAERASWQILDPDVLEWRLAHNPDANFIRDLFELRNTIEPSAAEIVCLTVEGLKGRGA